MSSAQAGNYMKRGRDTPDREAPAVVGRKRTASGSLTLSDKDRDADTGGAAGDAERPKKRRASAPAKGSAAQEADAEAAAEAKAQATAEASATEPAEETSHLSDYELKRLVRVTSAVATGPALPATPLSVSGCHSVSSG